MSQYETRARSIFLPALIVWEGTVTEGDAANEDLELHPPLTYVRVVAVQRYNLRGHHRNYTRGGIATRSVAHTSPAWAYRPDLITEKRVEDLLGEFSWERLKRSDPLHIHAVEALAMERIGAVHSNEFEATAECEVEEFAFIGAKLNDQRNRLYNSPLFAQLKEPHQWQLFVAVESLEATDGYGNEYDDPNYRLARLRTEAEDLLSTYQTPNKPSPPEPASPPSSNVWDRLEEED